MEEMETQSDREIKTSIVSILSEKKTAVSFESVPINVLVETAKTLNVDPDLNNSRFIAACAMVVPDLLLPSDSASVEQLINIGAQVVLEDLKKDMDELITCLGLKFAMLESDGIYLNKNKSLKLDFNLNVWKNGKYLGPVSELQAKLYSLLKK